MKKLSQIRTTVELSQADDRRSPLTDRVFSLAVAKPKGDRRKAMDCEMFSPAFFRAHFAASLGRVAPIGWQYEKLALKSLSSYQKTLIANFLYCVLSAAFYC